MVNEGPFQFHWRCKKEKISHLCFADDLIIFCKGEVASVSVVAKCLSLFKAMSGLAPNPDKSHLFTCGVARNVKLQMLSILGYKGGSLPVRYLGVPLVSTIPGLKKLTEMPWLRKELHEPEIGLPELYPMLVECNW